MISSPVRCNSVIAFVVSAVVIGLFYMFAEESPPRSIESVMQPEDIELAADFDSRIEQPLQRLKGANGATEIPPNTLNDPALIPSLDTTSTALATALRSDNMEIRKQIAMALQYLDGPSSFHLIREAMRDENSEVRLTAVTSLMNSNQSDSSKVNLFGASLQDSSVEVREQTLLGLAELNDPSALDYLRHAAEHDVEPGNRIIATLLVDARSALSANNE